MAPETANDGVVPVTVHFSRQKPPTSPAAFTDAGRLIEAVCVLDVIAVASTPLSVSQSSSSVTSG